MRTRTSAVAAGTRRLLLAGAGAVLLAGCGSATATPGPAPAAVPAPVAAPVVDEAPGTGDDASGTATCAGPAGFTVDHPAGWSVNRTGILPACSWFAPQPFEVPEASDVRPAPISIEILPVPFATAAPVEEGELSRTALEVDGRPAVRVELATGPGLWPVGTPVTYYAVDLGDRTLLADAVGLPAFDHERDVAVLDAMVASLELTDADLV